jgi:hypothetical protein
VESLAKKQRGDWFTLRENIEDRFQVINLLGLKKENLQSIKEGLRTSVEGGIGEYKNAILAHAFQTLDSLRFDIRKLPDLEADIAAVGEMLFLTILQYLHCTGKIPVHNKKKEVEAEPPKQDLKTIIADVTKRTKANPELEKSSTVKQIFMHVQVYRRELETMNQLVKNIPNEKRGPFLANFKNKFNEITGKIQHLYDELTHDERKEHGEIQMTHSIEDFDRKSAAPALMASAEQYSYLFSSLSFLNKERYQMADAIALIMDTKIRVLGRVAFEKEALEKVAKGDARFRRLFLDELNYYLDKTAANAELWGNQGTS